ncbi:hypothetical protein [Winogradskyella algicola]|uniref:hypothetical protein n=1 Tax=Winogradskyella algicola TaxID=2575815 RepID=UPI0011085D19|nr:hypothetical protein [Winogradskyella algicola]
MNTIRVLVLCLLTTFGYAQKKLSKISQSIKVDKDVVVDLNTSYAEIEIDTWNRDVVEIEAYLESDKLSDAELEKALEGWNLKVDGSNNKVVISSHGGRALAFMGEGDYSALLKDLEFELADFPEIPEVIVLPEIPELAAMPKMPELPEMPEFPELPELPEGIKTIKFDYDRYQKDGQKYLEEWSKRYEKEGGKELQKRMEEWAKKFAESGYQEKMEKWGEEFGEKYAKEMEKWGEEFGEKFGKEWEEKMEAWGERFGQQMERQAELMERQAELNNRISERTAKKIEREAFLDAKREIRKKALERRIEERKKGVQKQKKPSLVRYLTPSQSNSLRKVIKIKIPKKAKLKTNIRHGKLKISSVIYNLQGDISHAFLVADNIDGGDTSINVSYSPVVINSWNLGTLNLNYVDKAQIKNAKNLVLNAKSSNINIETLTETGIIDGSFGDLTISNLEETFKNLNLVLENSDAFINLPQNIDYSMYFKGNRSKFNNKATTQKTIRNYPDGQSSDRSIVVNAKFSNVIMN